MRQAMVILGICSVVSCSRPDSVPTEDLGPSTATASSSTTEPESNNGDVLPQAAEAAWAWTTKSDEKAEIESVLKELGGAIRDDYEELTVSYARARSDGKFILRERKKQNETTLTLKVRSKIANRPTEAEIAHLRKECGEHEVKQELDMGAGPIKDASVSISCDVDSRPKNLGDEGPPSLQTPEVKAHKIELKRRTVGRDETGKAYEGCDLKDWTIERWEKPDGAILWEISAKGTREGIEENFMKCTKALRANTSRTQLEGSKTNWAFTAH